MCLTHKQYLLKSLLNDFIIAFVNIINVSLVSFNFRYSK